MPDASDPLVSVIIATYNWSAVLRCAIRSVLWQTFTDFEVLVVGDGCTDDSAEVVASFSDPRVKWHNLPQNIGNQYAPNNTGLQMARGKYIAYLGHDDIWHPTHLELLVKAMQRSDCVLAYSMVVNIGAPETGIRVLLGLFLNGEYNGRDHLMPTSIMHTLEVVKQIGDWADYRTIMEEPAFEFLMRMWNHSHHFEPTNRLTAYKFNASLRPNSYITKRSDEQERYLERIQTEPDFIENELAAILEAYRKGTARFPKIPMPEKAPPGWVIDHHRRMRGLSYQKYDFTPPRFHPRMLFKQGRKFVARVLNKLALIISP